MGAGILPTTIHNNKLHFLFGKENKFADTPGWSDFGGGTDHNETFMKTALREATEELTGFLGDGVDIKNHIKKNGGIFKIEHDNYHVHVFTMNYDENLPKYYNQNHAFLWKRMDKQLLNKTKLFENESDAGI